VELTKESITSFINSKVNSCGREVCIYKCAYSASDGIIFELQRNAHYLQTRNKLERQVP